MTLTAVTGASGKLGRLVVERLLARGAGPVLALSRTPERIGISHPLLQVRQADFDDGAALAEALRGVGRMLIISTDALGGDGRRVRQHRAAIDAGAAAGVEHIVYTSVYKAGETPLRAMAADHVATEAMLARRSHTVLRNAFYDDLAHAVLARAVDGVFVHAAGEGGVAYVSREDCAEAAAVALTDGFDGGRVFEITGPEALSMDDLAAARGYRAVAVAVDELVERLKAGGMPEMMARVMAMIDAGIAAGAMAPASVDFDRLVGRRARRLVV